MNFRNISLLLIAPFILLACDGTNNRVQSQQENNIVATEDVYGEDEDFDLQQEAKTDNPNVSMTENQLKNTLQGWLKNGGIFEHAPKLLKLMNTVEKMAVNKGSEIGYFDYDVWQETQDEVGKEKVLKCSKLTNDLCVAIVEIKKSRETSYRSVVMSCESGQWEVVDFMTSSGESFTVICNMAIEEIKNW